LEVTRDMRVVMVGIVPDATDYRLQTTDQ
jgi:hypothetical protein